jgi:predicted transcriptional regulator
MASLFNWLPFWYNDFGGDSMIHRHTGELAENKLILLYILSKTETPLSKNQITQVVLENSLMNYFSMQQFLSELVQNGLVLCYQDMGKHLYIIHNRGLEILNLFSSRIPDKLKKDLQEYLNRKGVLLEKEYSTRSSYLMEAPGVYSVYLKLIREGKASFEMKIPAVSEKDAKKICANWNNGAEALSRDITKLLTKAED